MMKNVFFALLISAMATAQFNPGTITLNDGSSKTGYIETPEGQEKKVKFKVDQKSKVEKIGVENVREFEITNFKNEKEKYITLKLGNNKLFNPSEIKVASTKTFVKEIKKGKIGLYASHFKATSVSGGGASTRSHSYQGDSYYLQRPGDDYAFAIGTHRYDLNFLTGMSTYPVIEENFKDICPEFVIKLKEADLPIAKFGEFVEIYERTCN